MNLIDSRLEKIKSQKKIGLMTHVVVGYPSLKHTYEIVKTMEEAGVDFVELQIPFSDPLADGPTIMSACEDSLKNGTKVKDAFDIAKKLTQEVSIPILFMSYYNIVFKYGIQKFCQDAQKAGISGLIVPDMPIEEEKEEGFFECIKNSNLYNIQVLSPASTDERLQKNAEIAKGFVYCTSRQGITDAKKALDPEVAGYLKKVRKYFQIPIAVGFGISSKERVDMIRPYSQIAVIGSAIIDIINKSKDSEINKNVKDFIHSLQDSR